ncbi:MAG: DNA-binding protein WhiA [Clostridia bacterium]|nr:DNA-binding protein WhiA [Clostridia bacterium]
MNRSFSYEIKKELSELSNLAKKNEVKYELVGYLSSANSEFDKNKIKFSTENEYNINRFGKLLKNVDINDFKIDLQGKVYVITAKSPKVIEYLKQTETQGLKDFLVKAEELEKRAFVRGLFMGSGSVNNPENKYHLEIKVENSELIKFLIEVLKDFNINLKSIEKGIYIKEGEEISKFLAFIGANKSVLEFEQIRVQRDMNNKINRLVNCKTANLNKILNASVEQINAIKKLKENGNFNKMDKSLQELAELRLEYPDMPLAELGKKLKNPVGKSGVNYRLKKIIELSK